MDQERINEMIAQPVQSRIDVWTDPEGTVAMILLSTPKPGEEFGGMEALQNALSAAGVCHGIDEERLESLANAPLFEESFQIAAGREPVHGVDGTITYAFESLQQEDTGNLHTKVDFRELDLVTNVLEGQELAIIQHAEPGINGMDVFGKAIIAKQGRRASYSLGVGVRLDEGGTKIVAKDSGQVSLVNDRINVNPVYRVAGDVDFSVGNINFVGDVVIQGSVLQGFTVKAGGNIYVREGVQGATLVAEGNITISSGINGMGMGNIYCKGNLKAGFLENCTVHAQGNVVTRSIINCEVECLQDILLEGRPGSIMGGSSVAGGVVKACNIGSKRSVPTCVEIGKPKYLVQRKEAYAKELAQVKIEFVKLQEIIRIYGQFEEAGKLDGDKIKALASARYSAGIAEDRIRGLAESMEALEHVDIKPNLEFKRRIFCSGTLFANVTVVIGKFQTTTRIDQDFVSVYQDKTAIMFGPCK